MSKLRFRLVILAILLMTLFGAMVSTSSAQSVNDVYIRFGGGRLDSCDNTSWIATLTNVEFVINKAAGDVIWFQSTLPDGTSRSDTSSLNNQTSPQATWGVGYSFGSTPYPYNTRVWYRIIRNGTLLGTATANITCTGLNQGSVTIAHNTFFQGLSSPDGRVNFAHGDYNAVAYSEPVGANAFRFDLYCWDAATGLSTLAFSISQADVDAVGTPSENTLIASAPECGASFYVLTTGELQLNVVTDHELYVMISDSLNFDAAQRSRFSTN